MLCKIIKTFKKKKRSGNRIQVARWLSSTNQQFIDNIIMTYIREKKNTSERRADKSENTAIGDKGRIHK